MRKTSIYLRDSEVERLRELSHRTGRSQSELVREAVAVYEPAPPDRDFAIFADDERGPGDSVADLGEDELLRDFGA
jgi:predicted DNA-binding protein